MITRSNAVSNGSNRMDGQTKAMSALSVVLPYLQLYFQNLHPSCCSVNSCHPSRSSFYWKPFCLGFNLHDELPIFLQSLRWTLPECACIVHVGGTYRTVCGEGKTSSCAWLRRLHWKTTNDTMVVIIFADDDLLEASIDLWDLWQARCGVCFVARKHYS